MALIKCTECGKEVSENAVACPNCGNPITKRPEGSRKSLVSKFLWGIGIAILVLVVYMVSVAPSQQLTPEKAHKVLDDAYQDFKDKQAIDNEKSREYIRIIQSNYSTKRDKREAYNELIKIYESFSKFSIEEIENMK